jgi:hypothetical protein|tara:strand:- start:8 stop:271 length:264 start_codon:yes stop_codon:yes gene_type:complete
MDEILASIRPIDPSMFGGPPKQQGQPEGQQGQQGQQPFNADQYLVQKAMELSRKMKTGELGALGNVMAALPTPEEMAQSQTQGVQTA